MQQKYAVMPTGVVYGVRMCMRETAGKAQEHILSLNLKVNLAIKRFMTSTITALIFSMPISVAHKFNHC